jgi:hypothetical protein
VGTLPAGFALISGSQIGNGTPGSTYELEVGPFAAGTYTFSLQATDANGVTGVRTTTVIVPDFGSLNTSLPDAAVGVAYSRGAFLYQSSAATGWSLAPGAATPPGLTFSSAGVLSGTPTAAGNYLFSAILGDATGSNTYTFTIHVSGFAIATPLMLPTATAGVVYTAAHPLVTMTATGGTGLTWSATNLPPGLTMSAAGAIIGSTTAYASRYAPAITVTDGVTPTTHTFVLFVETPNPTQLDYVLSSPPLPDGTVGQVYGLGLIPDGGVPPYTVTLASGSTLPPGLSLLSGASLPNTAAPGATQLDGIPTTAGQYTFNLNFGDSTGAQITRTLTLNVTPIGFVSTALSTATTGVAYAQQLVPLGGVAPYTFTLSPNNLVQDALPPGLTLSSSGLLSGTPTGTGSFSAILKVQDSAGNTYTTTVFLTSNNPSGLRINSTNIAMSVGGSQSIPLTTSGSSTYTWSVPSGSLPTGLTLSTNGTITGLITAAGVYRFTVRATDTANSANFADRLLTYSVTPLYLTLPNYTANYELPAGTVGTAYSFSLRMAGGTPPYTFTESPFNPLPPGISLSAAGAITGTPTQAGDFYIRPVVTDANGARFINASLELVVTPAGGRPPLRALNSANTNAASLGVPYASELDNLLIGGTAPYTWSVTAGSSLPAGLTILNGSNGLPGYLTGTPIAAGANSFSLTATDATGQTVTVPFNIPVSPLSLTPGELPPGIKGSAYSATFNAAGGTAPYTLTLDSNSQLPPGLNLVNGQLSGTPLYAGIYFVTLDLADNSGLTLVRYYTLTIDDAAGEAPAVTASPNPINIYYVQGNAAPSIPLSIASTSGNLPFTVGVAGLTGASLSAASGTTGATGSVTLNIAAGSLAVGSYSGLIALQSPLAANGVDAVPVNLTVAAPPPCTYSLNPTSNSIPIAGGTGSFTIATSPGCAWTATTSGSAAVTITSATSGTGQATVTYSVPANAGVNALSGTIAIGGQTYTISQFGQTCSFSISPASFTTVAAGGVAPISITSSGASCPWTATGLSVTPTSGTGSGSATVTIPPNTGATTQTLSATIAGQTLTVSQTGVQCNVTLPGTSATSLVSGGAGSVAVTVPTGCSYATVPGPGWITITSGASGNASANLIYNVDPNSTTASRSGFLTIGGVPYQITQPGIACSITLDTSGLGSPFAVGGGIGTIGVVTNGANCPWTASTGSSFATVSPASGTGSGTVTVTVPSNSASTTSRAGSAIVAGQAVSFTQGGTTCGYTLQSMSATVPASGGLGSVGVASPSACMWTATSNNPDWLTIIPSATGGTATVQFVALPNTGGTPRTGTLTVAGQTFTVTEAGAPCSYSLASGSVTVGSPGNARRNGSGYQHAKRVSRERRNGHQLLQLDRGE